MQSNRRYEEIRVCDGIAERTGEQVDRSVVRRNETCCGSLTKLLSKARLLGDGTYYLPLGFWPADTNTIPIRKPWIVVSSLPVEPKRDTPLN